MTEQSDRAKESAPVDRLSQIWRRLNEHKIVQWTVAYLALAYAIQHALTLTGEAFEWPRAVLRLSMLLFALGLPLVVTFAWYHGARASRNFSQAELSILATLLVGVSLLFYVFVHEPAATATRVTQDASVTAARAAAASPKGAISVAVLPFLNLSSDKDQEFFSDGMTEEITAALAKVPDLRVVARTSAFEFKGKNVEIGKIGEQLHATHLIEGSVRKAGNRVRITAQLIKADDGTHVWAEDYDRDLTDIFAVQEDIARAITASLHMTLGLKPGENLINNRSIDPESYDEFLRARALAASRDPRAQGNAASLAVQEKAVSLLEHVVAKNSSYAPAWASLAVAYFLVGNVHAQDSTESIQDSRTITGQLRDKGEAAAKTAIRLDPQLGAAYTALGVFLWSRGKLLDADGLFLKAAELDSNLTGWAGNALRLAVAGRVKDALDIAEHTYAQDPFDPQVLTATVEDRWLNGDDNGAIALAKTARPATRAPLLALIYSSQGRFREAADALNEIATDPNSAAAKAARLLRNAPVKSDPAQLPALPAAFEYVYLYTGAPERALTSYERRLDAGYFGAGVPSRVWHPSFATVRKTERFKALMRKSGLVEYWRVKEWPAQCHPTTGDDFECS